MRQLLLLYFLASLSLAMFGPFKKAFASIKSIFAKTPDFVRSIPSRLSSSNLELPKHGSISYQDQVTKATQMIMHLGLDLPITKKRRFGMREPWQSDQYNNILEAANEITPDTKNALKQGKVYLNDLTPEQLQQLSKQFKFLYDKNMLNSKHHLATYFAINRKLESTLLSLTDGIGSETSYETLISLFKKLGLVIPNNKKPFRMKQREWEEQQRKRLLAIAEQITPITQNALVEDVEFAKAHTHKLELRSQFEMLQKENMLNHDSHNAIYQQLETIAMTKNKEDGVAKSRDPIHKVILKKLKSLTNLFHREPDTVLAIEELGLKNPKKPRSMKKEAWEKQLLEVVEKITLETKRALLEDETFLKDLKVEQLEKIESEFKELYNKNMLHSRKHLLMFNAIRSRIQTLPKIN